MKRFFNIVLLVAVSILPSVAQGIQPELPDSLQSSAYWHELKMLARAKGDSVLLRWAPDDYVSWRMLCSYGFDLVRFEYDGQGDFQLDTLFSAKRPLSSELMQQHFSPNDMMAGAVNTLLHSDGSPNIGTDSDSPLSGVIQAYEEQQSRFSLTMLVAELRFDLAEAMALGFTDKNVQPGRHYEYIIHAAVPDSILPIRSYAVELVNTPEPLLQYETQVTDSIIGPHSISLHWPYDTYTAYDIEQRLPGGEWHTVNAEPYMMLTHYADEGQENNSYDVDGLEPGTYEFRLSAYDSFGERLPASQSISVELPDQEAPSAPLLLRFNIDRSNKEHVFADIFWQKDVFEPDFAGYNIFYYHETLGNEWRRLNPELIAPVDTTYRCEVTGLASGFVLIQAVDTLGNYSPSTPYELHISDLEPPSAPTGLKHTLSADGVVTLSWTPNPENDVRGYVVYVANDTTHHFVPLPGPLITTNSVTDTISVSGVNQRFRYYTLRAFDYSGNRSELSSIHQVERINYTAPDVCRFDSVWQHEQHIYLRWHIPLNDDISHYRLYRRPDHVKHWTLVNTIPADSVDHKTYLLTTHDEPDYMLDHQYVYAIEAVNYTGISSGLSLPFSINHWGPSVRDVSVELKGRYNTMKKVVELTWTVPDTCPPDYYFVISSDKGRAGGNDMFTRIESVRSQERSYTCYWLKPQQTARFYVEIYWRDRTRGVPSNIITITNPYAPHHDENNQ